MSDIEQRLADLGITEDDLIERFVKGTGPGGQKINKTSSAVYLRHIPTDTEVKCQDGRSLTHNREEARRLLCEALEKAAERARLARLKKLSKIRAQKRRPSKNQKKINVANKRRQGEKKRNRKSPTKED